MVQFSPDVTAAMLVHRTIEKKVSWEFDSIIIQNMSHNLLTPTWPSYHVIENPSAVTRKIFFANVDKETLLVHFNPWHNYFYIHISVYELKWPPVTSIFKCNYCISSLFLPLILTQVRLLK